MSTPAPTAPQTSPVLDGSRRASLIAAGALTVLGKSEDLAPKRGRRNPDAPTPDSLNGTYSQRGPRADAHRRRDLDSMHASGSDGPQAAASRHLLVDGHGGRLRPCRQEHEGDERAEHGDS